MEFKWFVAGEYFKPYNTLIYYLALVVEEEKRRRKNFYDTKQIAQRMEVIVITAFLYNISIDTGTNQYQFDRDQGKTSCLAPCIQCHKQLAHSEKWAINRQ